MAHWKLEAGHELEAGIAHPGSWELDELGRRRAGNGATSWKLNI